MFLFVKQNMNISVESWNWSSVGAYVILLSTVRTFLQATTNRYILFGLSWRVGIFLESEICTCQDVLAVYNPSLVFWWISCKYRRMAVIGVRIFIFSGGDLLFIAHLLLAKTCDIVISEPIWKLTSVLVYSVLCLLFIPS